MARQIIWSKRAHNDRIEIFEYWNRRNKSNLYSKKLNKLFKEAVKLVAEYPEIGKLTDDETARIKIVRDYLIIYEVDEKEQLLILTIWDTRQSPEQLQLTFRE